MTAAAQQVQLDSQYLTATQITCIHAVVATYVPDQLPSRLECMHISGQAAITNELTSKASMMHQP